MVQIQWSVFLLPVNAAYAINLILVQVWDTMIIDSALKKFYNSDLSTMVQAIQANITVSFMLYFVCTLQQLKNVTFIY